MKQIKEQPKGRATAKADSGDKRMFPKINGYIRLHSSAYNNRQFSETNNMVRNINRILRKNYAILTLLSPTDKSMVSKADLTRHGFDFDYFTGIYTTRTNRVYYFCYDRGYAELENNKLILVRRTPPGENPSSSASEK